MDSTPTKPTKRTYFGLAALLTSILSGLFLLSNFGVAYLSITPYTFSQLNNLTALIYCIFTPLAFVLGIIGHTRRNDSRILSRIAISFAVIPFLIMFVQFVYSLAKYN